MKAVVIGAAVLIGSGLLGGLSYMVKEDFKNGNIPVNRFIIEKDNLILSYEDYDFKTRKIHSLYSNFFESKEIENRKPIYSFDNIYNNNKEVYTVRGDSIAITYQFNEKNDIEKEKFNNLKKRTYKKKIDSFKTSDVSKIYISRTANIMQTAYVVEFKEPKSINDLYKYTSNIVEQNNDNDLKEEALFIEEQNDFVNLYNSENTYKKLNISFSFSGNKAVIRNLVSTKQDSTKPSKAYQLIYKK